MVLKIIDGGGRIHRPGERVSAGAGGHGFEKDELERVIPYNRD